MTSANPPSLALIDGIHEELEHLLPSLSPKLAAVKLLEHIRSLPDASNAPQFLYYHVSSLRHLCHLILCPEPISSHIGFLTDLLTLLTDATSGPAAEAVRDLQPARTRLAVLLAAEHAIRDEWDAAQARLRSIMDTDIRIPGPKDGMEAFLAFLTDVDRHAGREAGASPIQWPYHLLRPKTDTHEHSIHTVLVDGQAVPARYREAYLALLSADVTAQPRRPPGVPIVHAKDERGEDLPLSEDLKDLVREGVDRALALLGPQAQTRSRKTQIEAEISLRRPSLISDLHGRSILLPLALILAHRLGEKLNLPFTISPAPSIVWTGDIDEHGNVKTVGDMDKKIHRVLASTASGFAFPSDETTTVDALLPKDESNQKLSTFPLTNLFDLTSKSQIVSIQNRNLGTRAVFTLRRKTRPLGIAGAVAILILAIAFAIVVPNMASWLDTVPVEARITEDHEHIRLLNSRDRTIREVDIIRTIRHYAVLLDDLSGDGQPEIFYGTSVVDSVPGTLFCLNSMGEELWRFTGGFRDSLEKPYRLTNTFGSAAASVHDVDRDGTKEVIAIFNHSPYFASQIALLTADGDHVASFWNRGHAGGRLFTDGVPEVVFADIDDDGFDEIITSGTNNGCDSPVLIILDPRSIKGKGPDCLADSAAPTCQSYVIFPSHPDLLAALGCARLHSHLVSIQEWMGKKTIRVEIWGDSTIGESRTGMFGIAAYFLDFDLNLVHLHYPDDLYVWADKLVQEGKTDLDIRSPEFSERMRQIEVIAGDPELLTP